MAFGNVLDVPLHPVTDPIEAIAATHLWGDAQSAVRNADTTPIDDDGGRFALLRETIEHDDEGGKRIIALERYEGSLGAGTFMVTEHGPDEVQIFAAEVAITPEGAVLAGDDKGRLQRMRTIARSIGSGAVVGTHVRTAVKNVDRNVPDEDLSECPTSLQASVTTTSTGTGEPSIYADLAYTRMFLEPVTTGPETAAATRVAAGDYIEATFEQRQVVQFDYRSRSTLAATAIAVEYWFPDENDPKALTAVAGPDPAATAISLQAEFGQTVTPLAPHPNFYEWSQLVREPLPLNDRLQPAE